MLYTLKTRYEGADIVLNYDIKPVKAELQINGRTRDAVVSDKAKLTIKLGSSVQTGYEYHEFIEAEVCYGESAVKATLKASGQILAEEEQARS